MARFDWDIKELKADIEKASEDGLNLAALVVQTKVIQNLNRTGTPTSKTGASNLARARSIFASGGNIKKASSAVRSAGEGAREIDRLGGLVDPAGGMPRKRTGNLAGSIVIDDSKEGVREIGPSARGPASKYAAIHEFGGIVTPKIAKFLKFRIGGKFIQTRRVVIPARPYMRPSLEQSNGEIVKRYALAIEQVFKKRGLS